VSISQKIAFVWQACLRIWKCEVPRRCWKEDSERGYKKADLVAM